MMILAVDTSGPVCGVAVVEEDRILSEYTARNKYTHSASLMPMVERCLESAGKRLEEMDALAAVTGPGSFTGVRIGVATVKGLAHGSGKPCIPVNALEALAYGANREDWEGLVCPMQDARAGQVYGAAFLGGKRMMEDRPMKLEDYLAAVRELHPGPYLLLGDRAEAHRERIRELTAGMDYRIAAAPFCFLRPSAAGMLAQRSPVRMDYRNLKEYYLRPPNAEKNKKLLEAMRHE